MVNRVSGAVLVLFFLSALTSGCATLSTPMDPPRVSLEDFSSVPSEGTGPRFQIKLRVQNPNEQTLNISGISYAIELAGKEVMTGVSNDIPVIEGYGEGVVTLDASVQLFQVLRLLASLGQATTDDLNYRFIAKIDFKGLIPTQRIEEEGQIKLK